MWGGSTKTLVAKAPRGTYMPPDFETLVKDVQSAYAPPGGQEQQTWQEFLRIATDQNERGKALPRQSLSNDDQSLGYLRKYLTALASAYFQHYHFLAPLEEAMPQR